MTSKSTSESRCVLLVTKVYDGAGERERPSRGANVYLEGEGAAERAREGNEQKITTKMLLRPQATVVAL
jgi:hypothetical protein